MQQMDVLEETSSPCYPAMSLRNFAKVQSTIYMLMSTLVQWRRYFYPCIYMVITGDFLYLMPAIAP